MDQEQFLKNFAKLLGEGAEEALNKIEEKKKKENDLLELFSASLSKIADFEVKLDDFEKEAASTDIKKLDEFVAKSELPEIIETISNLPQEEMVEASAELEPIKQFFNELVVGPPVVVANVSNTETTEAVLEITSDIPDVPAVVSQQPTTPEIITPTPVPKPEQITTVPAALRKELDLIKKTVEDFKRLLNRQAQQLIVSSNHGGGETWLHRLDDVSYQSLRNVTDQQVLTYDASLKKWVAADAQGGGGSGFRGSVGYGGSAGTSDTIGYTGSAGAGTGFQGSQGNVGYQGSASVGGFIGSQGATGYTGSAGTSGTSGVNGYTGSIGSTGYNGSAGFFGSAGNTGYEGSFGSIGYKGSAGDAGATGYTGSVGFAGSVGPQGAGGATGYVGSLGYTGSKGDQGFTGSTGIGYTGSAGYIGADGYTGSTGFTGSKGIDGYSGSFGLTGYVGSKGDQGIQGYTGSAGYIGADGYTGSTGFVGSKGDQGYTGSKGIDGYSGSAGYNGSIGATGATGYAGSTGFNGSAGYNGSIGALGYTGSIGYTGSLPTGITSNQVNTITIDAGYNFIPATDGTQNLGSINNRFKSLYLSGNTLYVGNVALSDNNGTLQVTQANGYVAPVATSIGLGSANGQMLLSNSITTFWHSLYTLSATPPSNPNYGDIWYYTVDNKPYMWVNDGGGSFWLDFLPSAG